MFAIASDVRMTDVTMSNATAKSGAALFVSYGSSLELEMCMLSNLVARTNGGIELLTATAKIYDSIFSNCTSESSGSGIYVDDSYVVMNNTIMEDMTAEKSVGAAIFAFNHALIDISHS